MKKLLLTITVSLAAFVTAHAQYSQYGTIENFYQANPDLDTNRYAGRVVNPGYWLIDWSRWKEMDDRLIGDGYVRLGISSWEGPNAYGNGVPEKALAVAYAGAIGADVVIYAVHDGGKYDYTAHEVAFYARQSVRRATPASNGRRPSSSEATATPVPNATPSQVSDEQATAAFNFLQDRLRKPRVKRVSYDPATDSYSWIGPKFGKKMSMPRSQFDAEIWPDYVKAHPTEKR